ncbi:MAG: hypothetical protein JNL57_01325 [Bacteroidetes bacterium]|nr:hypothetical protein [Bacteroidota bacterium]
MVIFPPDLSTPVYSSHMRGDVTQATLNLTGSSSKFWGITSVEIAGPNTYYLAGVSYQATLTNFLTTSPAESRPFVE